MNTPSPADEREELADIIRACRNGHYANKTIADHILAAGYGKPPPAPQGGPNHAAALLSKLVAAIENETPHFTLRKMIREGAPILHCNPPFETMSPESKGALVSIVTAVQDMFAKPDPAPASGEGK